MVGARWAVLGLGLAWALWGCVGPPESEDDKEEEQLGTAKEAFGGAPSYPVWFSGDASFEALRAKGDGR